MKALTFRVPDGFAYALKLAAVERHTTQTDIVIAAVEKYLKESANVNKTFAVTNPRKNLV